MNQLLNSPIGQVKPSPISRHQPLGRLHAGRLQVIEEQFQKMLSSDSPHEHRMCLDRIKTELYHAHRELPVGQWLKERFFRLFTDGTVPPASVPTPMVVVDSTAFRCEQCGQEFKSQPALNGHKKAHRA